MGSDAERLERLLRQEASLRQVIESISSELDLRTLLTRIAESACLLLEADNGAIGLVDEREQVVRIEATYRMPDDELGSEAKPGVGLTGKVMAGGKPVIVNRYDQVDEPLRTDLQDYAVIGVPIHWRGRLIGVFGIGSAPPRRFGDSDVDILSRFATHAAIAIENARLYDRAQTSLQEMKLLAETSERFGVALHPEEIVSAYLDQVAANGRYACTLIEYVFDDRGERVGVLVKGRWSAETGTVVGSWRLPYSRDALDDLLDRGESVMIGDVERDPRAPVELIEMQRKDGNPAIALIPLIAAGTRIGLVILTSRRPVVWDESELRPYQATAGHLAVALRHRHEQASHLEAERKVAILEDRQRLAHELHDSVTQLLTGINLMAQATPAAMQRDPAEGSQRLSQLAELSRRALVEMRALLAELAPREHRPATRNTATRGVIELIQEHLNSIRGVEPVICFESAEYSTQAPEIEHALYRITQEALSNAIKYAQAATIQVRLSASSEVVLQVEDDGVGLSGSGARAQGIDSSGLGLSGMRRRASDLGGSVRVLGRPGQGTLVEVRLPARPAAQN